LSSRKKLRRKPKRRTVTRRKKSSRRKSKRRTVTRRKKSSRRKSKRRTTTRRKKSSRRKPKRRTPSRRKKPRRKSNPRKKVPFGGYGINFNNRQETLQQVFGSTKITPSDMTKKLWKFIKAKRLGSMP